jgi:hypothetical protein
MSLSSQLQKKAQKKGIETQASMGKKQAITPK